MDGVLTWYHARGGPADFGPPLDGVERAEVCVVGGGFAGIGAALSLAERGRGADVVVLEAGRLGDGASGRNGGMISAGFTPSLEGLMARLGRERTRALLDVSVEGLELVRARIRRYAIACDVVDGVVELSVFDDPDGLRAYADLLRDFGRPVEFWPREKVRELWKSPRYFDAVFDPTGFHLDPLACLRGFARAAAAAGVRVFERTPVVRIEPRAGGGLRVVSTRGRVDAETVILAPGAHGPGAPHPALARALLGVVSYVVVTGPLGERLAEAVAAPHAAFDDRMATGYFRPLPEGRLLWGGRVSLFETDDFARIVRIMRRDLAKIFPQLSNVRIDFAWSGRMPFLRHKMPVVAEIAPHLWVATGFGGHGLNTTAMAGELVAAALVEGDGRWRLFSPFGLPPVFDGLGRIAAQFHCWWYQLRDLLRARFGI